jgi:hypothetical protein
MPKDVKIKCTTGPDDSVTVVNQRFATTFREVWIECAQDERTALVMLSPKKARRLATALLEAAVVAEMEVSA